jgi:hypothetical protein
MERSDIRRNRVLKILTDCLGSRYLKWLAAGALLVVLGLLAWGVAPKLVLSALPLLGIAVCLVPCLLPLFWLRRSAPPAAGPAAPPPASPSGDRPASP